MKWWHRLLCAFLDHDYDEAAYVPGSWTLRCKRCGVEVKL